MARSKSHDKGEEKTKSRRDPITYPYVVYASRGKGEESYWLILKFQDAWGARNMIEQILEGEVPQVHRGPSDTWDYMQMENGTRISLRDDERQREAMEIEYDYEKRKIDPDVLWFKRGKTLNLETPDGSLDNPEFPPWKGVREQPNGRIAKRGKEKTEKPAKRTSDKTKPAAKAKVDRTGKVSANDLAAEFGVEGRVVRGVLRALKLEKPAGGWLFDEATADDIRKKIKAGLKK